MNCISMSIGIFAFISEINQTKSTGWMTIENLYMNEIMQFVDKIIMIMISDNDNDII